MLELVTALSQAGGLLNSALDQYLNVCSAIQAHYTESASLTGVSSILAHSIANESAWAIVYETKLKRASSIVNQTRNISVPAPIHALPSEILARIFQLVVGDSCGIGPDDSKSRAVPKYPDYLSHICSHWRQVAINIPMLWAHLDLVYYHSSDERFADRARVFAARAKGLPLDIHIRTPVSQDRGGSWTAIHSFLRQNTSPIRSLHFTTPSTVAQFYPWIFQGCCDFVKPGELLEFSVTDHAAYTPNPIDLDLTSPSNVPDEDDDESQSMELFGSHELMEELLTPVKVLRLDGLYPVWTSDAYRGLTELRLEHPARADYGMGLLALRRILRSSPNLVTLHFGLVVLGEWDELKPTPACLPRLRVLNLRHLFDPTGLATFLSVFAPCSQPLELTMWLEPDGIASLSLPDSSIANFLKGSNVERLYLGGRAVGQILEIEPRPVLLPRLKALVLYGARDHMSAEQDTRDTETIYQPVSCPIENLYLQDGIFQLDLLLNFVKKCSVRGVVLWKCQVYQALNPLTRDRVTAELSPYSAIVRQVGVEANSEDPNWEWGGWV